jgi:hypothetical protein
MLRLSGAVSGLVVVLLTTACGGAPAPPASSAPQGSSLFSTGVPQSATPAGVTSTSPESSAAAVPSLALPNAEDATYLAAAEAELAMRRQLRDDVGVAELIGPAGPALIDFTEQSEQAFGEKYAAQFVQDHSIDLTGLAAPRPIAAISGFDDWSGSLLGLTSFAVSTWLAFAPQSLHNLATADSFDTQTETKTEPYDKSVQGVHEHLVVTQTLTIGAGLGRLSFDVVMTSASVMSDDATGAEIARRTSTDSGHFEIQACPDANGVGEGSYKLVDQEDVSTPGGIANGGQSSTDATFRVYNGDDAHLIRTEVDASLDAGAHGSHPAPGGGSGDPFNWDAGQQFTITIPASGASTFTATGGITGHDATADNAGALGAMLAMADHFLAEAAKAAEKFWRSGDCIEVKPDQDSGQVTPGQQVDITVSGQQKFDKQPVPAPIKAVLTGVQEVSPADTPVPAPAKFTFTAGSNADDKGSIEFTQTGKRGIGKATVQFIVGGQSYEGDFGGVRLAGSLHYMACTKSPYWALDYGAPFGFVAYDLKPGETGPTPAVIVTGGDTEWTRLMKGTGQFVPGNPAHFIIVNGEGTWDVTLHAIDCVPPPAQ